jgi:hypothetical protein
VRPAGRGRSRLQAMTGYGPELTTCALQQVFSFLGYSGHQINVVVTAANDPKRKSGGSMPLPCIRRLLPFISAGRTCRSYRSACIAQGRGADSASSLCISFDDTSSLSGLPRRKMPPVWAGHNEFTCGGGVMMLHLVTEWLTRLQAREGFRRGKQAARSERFRS